MSIKKINVEIFPLNRSLHCVVIFSHVTILLPSNGSVHRTFIHSTRVIFRQLQSKMDRAVLKRNRMTSVMMNVLQGGFI